MFAIFKYVTEQNVSAVHFVRMFAFHMYVTGKNVSTVQFVRMFAFYMYVTEKYTSIIQKFGALHWEGVIAEQKCWPEARKSASYSKLCTTLPTTRMFK